VIGELRWALDYRNRNGRWLARQAQRCGSRLLAEGRPRISRGAPDTHLVFGDDVYLYYDLGFFLDSPGATIEIGDRTYVNRRTEIICQDSVRIGADCLVSWEVMIADTDYHAVGDAPVSAPVVLEDLVWVGARATSRRSHCARCLVETSPAGERRPTSSARASTPTGGSWSPIPRWTR